jgi:hypothetical protein
MAARRVALLRQVEQRKAQRPAVPDSEMIVHEIRGLASVEVNPAKSARSNREAF